MIYSYDDIRHSDFTYDEIQKLPFYPVYEALFITTDTYSNEEIQSDENYFIDEEVNVFQNVLLEAAAKGVKGSDIPLYILEAIDDDPSIFPVLSQLNGSCNRNDMLVPYMSEYLISLFVFLPDAQHLIKRMVKALISDINSSDLHDLKDRYDLLLGERFISIYIECIEHNNISANYIFDDVYNGFHPRLLNNDIYNNPIDPDLTKNFIVAVVLSYVYGSSHGVLHDPYAKYHNELAKTAIQFANIIYNINN